MSGILPLCFFKAVPLKRFIILVAGLCATVANASILNIEPNSVEAAVWTIYDPQTKQTIAEYNSHAQRAPASLTKMMVAYITLKEIKAGKLKTSDILTATNIVQTIQPDESQMFLKQGQQISVDQLLAGLIVMSANDAAVTLAEKIGGTVPHFVDMMNQEAKALGMTDTHFTNPAGITMEGHYSSASDLAKLGNTLIQDYPNYLGYSKQTSYTFNNHQHHATNLLLKLDPTVDGLKTGYTAAAGYNLALTAERPTLNNKRRLIVVVMGTKSAVKRAEVAYELMNMAYTYTRDDIAIKANQRLATLPVQTGQQDSYTLVSPQNKLITTSLYEQVKPIDMRQFDHTTGQLVVDGKPIAPITQPQTQISLSLIKKSLTAPINSEIQLAHIKVMQHNEVVEEFPISTYIHIERSSVFTRFFEWLKNLLPFFDKKSPEAVVYPIN